MAQSFMGLVSVLVPCYDAAIECYCDSLGFHLVQDDRVSPEKRWVVVKPDPLAECGLLLAKAANDAQSAHIGQQTGGRVFLFLYTDDFHSTYCAFLDRGVEFLEILRHEPYGRVAKFQNKFGNIWDLLEKPN